MRVLFLGLGPLLWGRPPLSSRRFLWLGAVWTLGDFSAWAGLRRGFAAPLNPGCAALAHVVAHIGFAVWGGVSGRRVVNKGVYRNVYRGVVNRGNIYRFWGLRAGFWGSRFSVHLGLFLSGETITVLPVARAQTD